MKYEMIFGNPLLFDGAPDDIVAVRLNNYQRISHGYLTKEKLGALSVMDLNAIPIVAMRRIIKEPKRWTLEDKKAGRLPELGALVCDPGNNVGSFVGAGIHEGEPIFFLRYEADRCEFWLASACKPIETLDEKARRERDAWAKKASQFIDDELDCVSLVGEHVMRRFYNAMLSGELAVPKWGE